jgi:hypothetical protein
MTANIFDEWDDEDEVEDEEFDCEMDEGWDDDNELEYLLAR